MHSRRPYIIDTAAVILMDCVLLNLSIWLSCVFFTYLLKQDSPVMQFYFDAVIPITLTCAVVFPIIGVHKIMWRLVSLYDILLILVSVFVTSFIAYVILKLTSGAWQNPILPVTWFYLFLSMSGGVRMLPSLMRIWLRITKNSVSHKDKIRVLIVGAGDAADALIKDMSDSSSGSQYHIVGLVDDDTKKLGHALRGKKVLGSIADVQRLIATHRIHEIIVAIPSATTEQRRNIITATLPTGCKVRTMSKISHLEAPGVSDLHDIDISDLLNRPEVYLNADVMATYITGSVVLVTGGGGSIGSELCRQIMLFNPKSLVIFDIYENNAYNLAQELRIYYKNQIGNVHVRIGSVQSEKRLDEVFAEFKPDVVFHAAAYKHVPLMEQCPYLAIENNVFGTYNAAMAALNHNTRRFVMISTDKAVNPTNIMGASKRISELIIQSLNGKGTEFMAVRFGNVLGSNGSVVPIFRRQIETGGPVTITHPEIIRYFMTIPEAARLVLQAGAIARGGETFVLDMGDPVKIIDLATTMIEMAGLIPNKDILIEYTGLRPGEKLYEELLLNEEGTAKTQSDKIYVAAAERITDTERNTMLSELAVCLENGVGLHGIVKKYVPSYHEETGDDVRIWRPGKS